MGVRQFGSITILGFSNRSQRIKQNFDITDINEIEFFEPSIGIGLGGTELWKGRYRFTDR